MSVDEKPKTFFVQVTKEDRKFHACCACVDDYGCCFCGDSNDYETIEVTQSEYEALEWEDD